MSAKNFKPSLALVLAHEGGFSDHPSDPGGPTMKGVTQRVYDAYRKVKGLALQSVRYISELEIAEIYKKQYWQLVRGDELPAGLDYAVFDFAVNSGISRAIRYLQRTLGVNDDAVIGDGTLGAVYKAEALDPIAPITAICNNRMAFLQSLSTFPTFGKGWTRRVCGQISGVQVTDTGVIDYAVNMATKDIAFTPLPATIGTKPGEIAAKGISDDYESWPMSDKNDYLAKLIAAS